MPYVCGVIESLHMYSVCFFLGTFWTRRHHKGPTDWAGSIAKWTKCGDDPMGIPLAGVGENMRVFCMYCVGVYMYLYRVL
jgi:hypothetical protein